MGNPQYIQDAVDNFEDLYGEELTEQQQQNFVEALEYGKSPLVWMLTLRQMPSWLGVITPATWSVR